MNSCNLEAVLDILSGKWSLRILICLCQGGVVRFNELRRSLPGISNNKLSQCLKEFEKNKIVVRMQYNEIPPRVEYSLTELGRELQPAIVLLDEWAQKVVVSTGKSSVLEL